MIYRVRLQDDADGTDGYVYTTSKREAERELAKWRDEFPDLRQGARIEHAPTPRTRKDVIRLLNSWGSHADNG